MHEVSARVDAVGEGVTKFTLVISSASAATFLVATVTASIAATMDLVIGLIVQIPKPQAMNFRLRTDPCCAS